MHVKKLKKSDNNVKEGATGERILMSIPMERCRPHTYMGNESFEVIIKIIRQIAPAQVFIAESTAVTYISYMRKNPKWKKIRSQFGHIEVVGKPDGIYLFPVFTSIECDHWHTMILRKRASLWFGWIIDSFKHGRKERV